MTELALNFLGAFAVSVEGQPLTRFRSDKVRALLAYLALEPARSHPRQALAALLWPEVTDKQALQSLRTALYYLRQTLDRTAPGLSRQLLTVTHHTVCFKTEAEVRVITDVINFQTQLAASQAHPHKRLGQCVTCLEHLKQAANLYQGELLAGFSLTNAFGFEEWLLLQREMLHQRALLTLKCLADAYETQADYDRAYPYAARLARLDPYWEASQRRLMRLLARRGLPEQALAHFARYCQLLKAEFETDPEAETLNLIEQIRRGQLSQDAVEPGSRRELVPSSQPPPAPRHDWDEIPRLGTFFGRHAELAQLRQWVVGDDCRLVAIWGMGGLGKTALAAHTARSVAGQVEIVIWRSLLNAPTLDELLPSVLSTLAGEPLAEYPNTLNERLARLLLYLRQKRCLLVLDNLEAVLQSKQVGQYRPGYEDYGQLIQHLGNHQHQSCLLLTSRESPQELTRLERNLPWVQSLLLSGMETAAGQEILQYSGLSPAKPTAATVVRRYSGNPLALSLVADTIQNIYLGDVEAFLGQETPIFGDIREVLDQQFCRLLPLEQDILLWLAISRKALTIQELATHLIWPVQQRALVEALRSLQRRSLLETSEQGFRLSNVLMEYLTDILIERVSREIESGHLELLSSHALLQAQATTDVRQNQTRFILHPIAKQLVASLGLVGFDQTCRRLLDQMGRESRLAAGYAADNILNLLLHVGIDVTGYDFSCLTIPVEIPHLTRN
ncbi:MAG: hypothetical protein KDI02_00530 [Anaerolineae bacterium]|nr:hypothetical protein [Anaerolineae bacterium]